MLEKKYLFVFVIIVTLIWGCERPQKQVEFQEKIKGKEVNLSKKVGHNFEVLRAGDTIEYFLSYNKSTNENLLIRNGLDTLFHGTVTKRNELFLLNRKLHNGNYCIHALQFTDSTIVGLETENLQSTLLIKELKEREVPFIDTLNNYSVKVDKKVGKAVFRKLMQQLKPERRIRKAEKEYLFSEEEDVVDFKTLKADISVLIDKVYPNPFENQITIKLHKKDSYVFKVFDSKGLLVNTVKQNTDKLTMDIGGDSKYYFLKILDKENRLIDEFKLYKK